MFNFTQQERQVVLFLVSAALVGIGINFWLKRYSPIKTIAVFYQDIGKINLNTADKDMLLGIPGIGEKLARRILDYRDKQTGFSSVEELKDIKGINNYRYEKIKDYLIVR